MGIRKRLISLALGGGLFNARAHGFMLERGESMHSLVEQLSGYWNEPEVATNSVILINILGALMLGLLVGYERSYRGRAAGMRTYGLVCMASCALTVITGYPEFWFGSHSTIHDTDPGRVIQGIITGVGFLGAGVIMRDGLNISGLTTAASIWSVAVIGILVGVGFYAAAIPLAMISAVFMMWGSKIEGLLPARHAITVHVRFVKGITPSEEKMLKMARKLGYEIARGSFSISERESSHEWKFVAVSNGKGRSGTLVDVSTYLSSVEGIDSYQISHARN
jgi:putative Mg2+ transporter-C (MgtC) family protein